jgi:small ligand-binding sensory domain FIST
MKWASTVSDAVHLEAAVNEAVDAIRVELGSQAPNLLVVFASDHHKSSYDRVPSLIGQHLSSDVLIGCSAGGVIGGGREVERRPGLSLTAAVLPAVKITPVRLDNEALPGVEAAPAVWEELVHVSAEETPHFVLLPDPFSFDAERLVRGLDRAFPRSTKVGGLASGGTEPGANALYMGRNVYRSGLVGVALSGNVEVETIVAQGCRPIGEPMFVTRCEHNTIAELDGRPLVEVLKELYERADPRDRQLFQHSLFIGIVMEELQQEYRQGDFLVRNILGLEDETGRLVVGAVLRDGLVVQFQLRDAKTSAVDLSEMLSRYESTSRAAPPEGSLLFACLGRGMHLYGEPDHDTAEYRRRLGDVPLGGFFCNGEIGPVNGTTFLQGYTSSFGFFRSRK